MAQQTMDMNLANDLSVKFGEFLAHPPPGEEVVISGMSGQFPLSSNIDEYKYNLFNKVNMVSHIPQRNPEVPPGLGKLNPGDLSKFDTGFFGVCKREARTMNAMTKLLLEKCVECIFDAGLHPEDLEGTRTGVYCGICFTENESHWFIDEHIEKGNAICGNMKGMIVNRISYFLKLKGPSTNTDTACSSTSYALENAFVAIRTGLIDQAIVCGANSLLSAGSTLQFARLGVLSKEGVLRAFDEDGKGYVRAEAASAVLLQKSKDSNRIYAQVIHTKTNCDGYKEEGITYPSGEAQLNLLKEIYLESGVNPKDMSFIEAHGTGTIVGDPEELNGIDTFFTKGRSKPLLVGSVKSSIGHTEPVSGLCSIVKAILAFETNIIPPNINFKSPRKNIPGLLEGRMQVVVEQTPFQDKNGLIGISSFGFGGGNAHVVLKWNTKMKLNNGKPLDNLPRLVCVSGRTEEAVDCLLNDVAKKFDVEHIALIHNSFRKAVNNHLFRGYVIVSKQGVMKQSVSQFSHTNSNLHIYFGGLSRSSGNLAQELLSLSVLANFKNSLLRFLTEKNLNLNSILSNEASSSLNFFLSEMITQLTLSELLKQLQVEYKCVSGHSFGEFTAAYFENSLRLEEVLECVYSVAEIANDFEKNKNGGRVPIVDLNKYRNKIETEFKRVMTVPKQFNGYNGTEVKTTTPEYFVDAILQTKQNEPNKRTKNSIVLKIGHSMSLFSKKQAPTITLNTENGIQGVLETLGSLYEYGIHPQVQKLYPEVQFPVSRGTPMISSKIKWKHDYDYFVPTFEYRNTITDGMKFNINFDDDQWTPLSGHVVDGRNLFPATGYIYLVWFVFSEIQNIELKQIKVVFENCKFKRACTLPKKDASLELTVTIQRSSGNFEVSEGDVTVVTGRIRYDENLSRFDVNTSFEATTPKVDLLESRDIYKELRLRGYNYKGLFKSIVKCDKKGTFGKIRWANHWIAFMDNMLQLNILAEDTRLLYVPTRIASLAINPNAHLELVEKLRNGEEKNIVDLPIEYNHDTGNIRSGGIEIRGLLASSIPRKKLTALPVLEKYQFVPNESKLPLEQSVRVFVQVALENNCGYKVKVAEILERLGSDDEILVPLAPIIQDVLGDQPLVTGDITIFTSENLDVPVNVETKNFSGESEYTIVVGRKLLTAKESLADVIEATVDEGFIISREPIDFSDNITVPSNLVILNISESNGEKLVFLRKQVKSKSARHSIYVNVSTKNRTFSWLTKLKEATSKDCDVIAWCQGEPLNGIIGLVNCIRREPGCQEVRSVFIVDQAPDFDPSIPFYKNQLDKNMGVNVFMNGQWGTYRHLLLETMEEVENEHCFVNSTVRGDISSLRWIEGPLNRNIPLELNESLVDVYYSSLNFRDVMTASGRINVDVITRDRREQECVQGFEFSGKTIDGKRVMGMVAQGALATLVKADNNLMWNVPDHWTLKDAATVPVVYGTCLYALVVVGRIKPTDSVLIHSGTGGIGQAAINLCLNMGCTVFTTVGTEEKKQFIRKNFPQIKASHIGNSRDLSFEQMIYRETCGRGVDIVLNSLAEEKLFASVRCLAVNGRFLEIGKFDLANDNQLDLVTFKKAASYHGVMLDKLFNESAYVKERLQTLIQKYIDSGAIKPLMANVFDKHEVVQAFRYMTAGKHMGKVLIEVRKENETDVTNFKFKGLPRYFCDPNKSYIICGGLGGFGLELADWLVLRGAKNLILTSRKGISSGYQSYRISVWKSYCGNVKISTQDITTKSGCEQLIKEANSIAPVHAIFNLAVVLEDAILENQTEKSFKTSFGPKAYATEYLDEITRKLCPNLRDFVIFSSVSCGRGNAGQSNYGMSNSVMERICEKRRREGYPALAIEWGAIGDVGLVAASHEDHIELEIGGTLQQSIANCLQVMDVLLRQNEAALVSSIVVAEKKSSSSSGKIEEVIGGILGIRDIKVVSLHSTLAEIGMDSMSAVEVKQTLEREYNIFLSPSEIRSVTLARIKELGEQQIERVTPRAIETLEKGFDPTEIYRNYYLSNSVEGVIKLKTRKADGNNVPRIIALPGVEGCCDLLENLTSNMEVEAYGINYEASKQTNSYPETAERLLPDILDLVKSHNTFNIISHSMGCYPAVELVARLEKLGYLGTLTLLDGSPSYIRDLSLAGIGISNFTHLDLENAVLAGILRMKINEAEIVKASKEICMCKTLQEKLKVWLSYWKSEEIKSEETLLQSIIALINRTEGALTYKPTFGKIKSKVKLYKPSITSYANATEDYDLGQYCEQPVDVKINHIKAVGGNDAKDLSDRILKKLFTNSLAEVCSWTGRKGNYEVGHLNCMKIIYSLVHQMYKCSSKEFELIVMDWLRHAKQQWLREARQENQDHRRNLILCQD